MGVLYIASFPKSTFTHSVTSFVVYSFLCRCLELCAMIVIYAIIKSSEVTCSYDQTNNVEDVHQIPSPNNAPHPHEDESDSNSQLSTVRHPFYPRSPSPTTRSLLMEQQQAPQYRASDSPQRYYQPKQQRSERSAASQLPRSPNSRLQSHSPSRIQPYSPRRTQGMGVVMSPPSTNYVRTYRKTSVESRISGRGYAAGDEFSLREDSHSSTPPAKLTIR